MRYEAAVRSVTALYKKDTDEVILGKNISFQADTPYQVVMASANRDPAVFQDPNKFNPSRSELGDMLSWNGRLKDVEAGNRTAAPRLCPGHCLSLKLGALVCASFMGLADTTGIWQAVTWVRLHQIPVRATNLLEPKMSGKFGGEVTVPVELFFLFWVYYCE